jgi:hypothetical protein
MLPKDFRQDYSGIAIEYAKSVEILLVDLLNKGKDVGKIDNAMLQKLILALASNYDISDMFLQNLEDLRIIRNKAAHKVAISKDEVEVVRNLIISEKAESIFPYANNLLA